MVLENDGEVLMLAMLALTFKERGSKSKVAVLEAWGSPTWPEQGEWSEERWGWASFMVSVSSHEAELKVYTEGDGKHGGRGGMTWILLP